MASQLKWQQTTPDSVIVFILFLSLPFPIVTQVLWLDEERVSSDVSSNLEAAVSKQLPQQTSPHPSFASEVMEDSAIMIFT